MCIIRNSAHGWRSAGRYIGVFGRKDGIWRRCTDPKFGAVGNAVYSYGQPPLNRTLCDGIRFRRGAFTAAFATGILRRDRGLLGEHRFAVHAQDCLLLKRQRRGNEAAQTEEYQRHTPSQRCVAACAYSCMCCFVHFDALVRSAASLSPRC